MNTKKRLISFMLSLIMLFSLAGATVTASAAKVPDVRVNGRLVDFPDQKPFIENGRTFIPVRFVAEALGADVAWSRELKGAVIKRDGIELQLPIGSNIMTIIKGGEKSTVTMDTEAKLLNGRTLVPIRFVAEALGAWVSYSTYYSTVQIYDDVLTPDEINYLHSLVNHWDVCDERAPLLQGNYGYENLNECIFRDFQATANFTVTNIYTGETFTNFVDSIEDKALFVVDFIRHSLAEEYTMESLGAHATFRTDVSCTAAHPPGTSNLYMNRGYLTITFDEDADVARYKSRYDYRNFGNIQPGGTYTYVLESLWMIEIGRHRMPLGIREFDRTSGTYTQWQ